MTSSTSSREGDHVVLGGGCFWCLEAVFQDVDGVLEVTSGYAGGHDPDPDYRKVCGGGTGHAEVVRIDFDAARVSLSELLHLFFVIHDPTTPNRQGADVGPQYRSIILPRDDDQEHLARELVRELEGAGLWNRPFVTEIARLERFHPAEPEHENYYRRNPGQAYCQVVIAPKLAKARSRMGQLFRE